MWAKKNVAADKAIDLAKADRAERFEIYKLMVEMADRVSQRRQVANSFYLSINTFLITASAYIGTTPASTKVTLMVCFAGLATSHLWTKSIESYKSLNTNKFEVINALEKSLVAQPYSDEWEKINPALNGRKHRPFHQTERLVPKIFMTLFLLQALALIPWRGISNYFTSVIRGALN